MLLKSPVTFTLNGQTALQQAATLPYSVVIPLFNDAEILQELQLGSLPSEGWDIVEAFENENRLVTQRLISTSH